MTATPGPTAAASLVGVDVGGTGIKAALVDLGTGQAGGRTRVETPRPATPDAVAGTVAALVRPFRAAGTVGCTLPAVVTGGVVRTASHIDASWIGTHASTVLSRRVDRPVVVLNDADAAGVAEARFGAARGRRGVAVMVTIGTGVGTAVLNDGVLVANSELGHLEVNGHVADAWLSDATRTDQDVSWKRWTRRLDRYLTHLHELLWPDLIVVGGGIAKHADRFLDRVDPGCEVRVAELGNLAGIVGAALVAGAHVPVAAPERS